MRLRIGGRSRRWLRWLTYQKSLVRVARALRVNLLFRDLYCRAVSPADHIIRITFEGVQASFQVHSPLELRIIEAPLEKGMGEYFVLKRIFHEIGPGDVVYDVGASLGTHSILMAKKVGDSGRVVAFEPEEMSYCKLLANVKLNHLNNIRAYKFALGDRAEQKRIYGYGGGFGSFNLMGYGHILGARIVKILRGDDLVVREGLPAPGFVKIDVEGYEYQVIVGLERTLKNPSCRSVFCEIHPKILPKGVGLDDVFALLRSYGYEIMENNPRGETIHGFFQRA